MGLVESRQYASEGDSDGDDFRGDLSSGEHADDGGVLGEFPGTRAVAFSFVGRDEPEVVDILRSVSRTDDVHAVDEFNARVRAGEVLSSMLIRERILAREGFCSFYHSIGPQMLAVAATITALAQKFGDVAMAPRSVILRPPIAGISDAPFELQHIIDRFLAGGSDTGETARSAFASVVLSATNMEVCSPHMRKVVRVVDEGALTPAVVDFDPEMSVPRQLLRARAYSNGPVSGMGRDSVIEHAVNAIADILEASGIEAELGVRTARGIVDLAAPANSTVSLSFRKDIASQIAFVTTNGGKHAFLLEDAIRASIEKEEPVYYQGRVVCDYTLMTDSRYARTRVYHTSPDFDFDVYIKEIKRLLHGLNCAWPPRPLQLRLRGPPRVGTVAEDNLANQQLKRLIFEET